MKNKLQTSIEKERYVKRFIKRKILEKRSLRKKILIKKDGKNTIETRRQTYKWK